MTKAPPQKFVTKKTMARLERERLQKRYIRLGAIVIVAIVLLIIGYGILDQQVLKFNRTVATVDGQKITLREFQTLHKYSRWRLIQQYEQTAQFAAMFGTDQTFSEQFTSSMQQIKAQLTSEYASILGSSTVDQLISDKIVKIEAAKANITVSDEEIEKTLKEAFAFYPDGTSTPLPTREQAPTSTLSALQMTLVPPTATPTQPAVTTTPTLPPTPTATVDPTVPTTTPFPTATPVTLEGYQGQLKTYVDQLVEFGFSEADLRQIIRSDLLYSKFLDFYTKDIETNQEQVWVRHIVTTDEQKAKDAVAKLNSGTSFRDVAAEFSESQTNDGDLGWLTRGEQEAAVELVAFGLDVGKISEPVQTATGWEIIQVLGHEVRQVSDERLDALRSDKLTEFLNQQKASDRVKKFDTWQNEIPTEPVIPE